MAYINPFLYKYYASFINDITSGDNKCSAVTYEPVFSDDTSYTYTYTPYFLADKSAYYSYYYSPPVEQPEITCCEEGFYATKGWDPVTG